MIDLKVPVYQIGPTETIVFFGCTPPPSRYFGLQVTSAWPVFFHLRHMFSFSPRFLPPLRGLLTLQSYAFLTHDIIVFASLGDSINFLTVNVSGPTPFDQVCVFSLLAHSILARALCPSR